MLPKTKKSRTILQKIILYSFISFLGGAYVEQSAAGGGYSDYSDLLIDGLVGYLIKYKVCDSEQTCGKMIETFTEGTKRVYINMYGQTNTIVTTYAVAFFIEEALNVSNGIPVTFSVYPKPHDDYVNQDFFSKKDHLIQLTLNKGKNHAL